MKHPNIADNKPKIMEIEPGDYYWCACGLSKNQPFCDGSHKDTDFEPKPVKVLKKETKAWCMCKQSCNKPYCDGTHNKLK